MTERLCGYVLDNDRPMRPFFAGVPSRSSLPDRWRVWTPDALDQGSTQSCTGFAAKLMIDGTAHSTGKGFRASARGMYTVGRYALYGAGEPLVDKGAHFRSLFDEAMRFGVMHEADCPWDPARINEDPGFEAVIAGQGQKLSISGWYTLDEDGDDRMNAIRSALHQGFPVGGAWRIHKGFQKQWDDAFDRHSGHLFYIHQWDTGDYVGNHAMTIVGYDTIEGEEYFLMQNSWGPTFGDRGLFWAHRDWIDTAWDLTVVRVVPLAKPGEDRQQDHHADDHVRVGTHEQERLPHHAPRKLQHPAIVPENPMKNILLATTLLLASCIPQPRSKPTPPPPDQACAAACVRLTELKEECHYRADITTEECSRRCNEAERLRPGLTKASCVAVALTCEDVKACEGSR
jgi:hypothetical protein